MHVLLSFLAFLLTAFVWINLELTCTLIVEDVSVLSANYSEFKRP